jgi:ubiquinone/menaquinone biosynthesis C-methylase UbiE
MTAGSRHEQVEAFFDAEAGRYDAGYDADDWSGRFLRARMNAVLEALGDGGGRVLDAGMGGGRLVAELDRRGWDASGVDSSGQMVELAVGRLPHLAGRLRKADLAALPFPDSSFDAVAATGVVEYVEDLDRGLRELARVLRPGGTATVSFPNYRSPYSLWRGCVLYPAARLAKRVLPLPRPAPLRPLHPIPSAEFEAALGRADLRLVRRVPVAPRFGGDSRAGRLVAPQFLFRAER